MYIKISLFNSCIEFHFHTAVPDLLNQLPVDGHYGYFLSFCYYRQGSELFPCISHRVLRGNLDRPTMNAPWVITMSMCIKG